MKKALLVVDMQNVCVGENHSPFFKYDNYNLIASVNAVISGYTPENVYYIMNMIDAEQACDWLGGRLTVREIMERRAGVVWQECRAAG